MKTSTEIFEELQVVLTRLEGVEAQYLEAQNFASELVRQVALDEGQLSDLQTANLSAATLRSVVEEVAGNRNRLEGDLAAAKSAEAHETLFAQAAGYAGEADKAWSDYLAAWKAGLAGIESLAQAVAAAEARHWESRWAFNLLPEPETFLSELRDRNIATEALTSVPLNGASLNFSRGNASIDIRFFEGEAWQELAHQVKRILHERNLAATGPAALG